MKRAFPLTLVTLLLATSMIAPALADQLVITLQNGRTIVLDTAEIRSMTFNKTAHGHEGGDSLRLVPSPKNFSGNNRPPGSGQVTVHPIRGRDGNVAVSVTLSEVRPNQRFNVYMFVDGRNFGDPTPLTIDRFGFGQCSGEFSLPPGERTVAVSITPPDSDTDIYVTPGIYENQGLTVRVPRR